MIFNKELALQAARCVSTAEVLNVTQRRDGSACSYAVAMQRKDAAGQPGSGNNRNYQTMEASSQRRDGRGLNNPRAQYSKETQDMLRSMMQQSRLTNLQRKQINECLKNGVALPLTSDPTSSASPTKPKTTKAVQKRPSCKPQRRSAEACRSGNSYVREKFHPGPLRDLEKEKTRLQNILATGKEQPTAASYQNVRACPNPEVAEQKDQYQEVLDEIEERRQFLADMSSLGQEKQYVNIINTQISQRIRELQVLDKDRSPKNDAVPSEREGESAEQIREKME